MRYARVLQGGQFQLAPNGSGTSSDLRFCGPGGYIYSSNAQTEITGGLSAQWPLNPGVDARTSNSYGYLTFIPRWQDW